jgi:hypothetical protein
MPLLAYLLEKKLTKLSILCIMVKVKLLISLITLIK